MRVELVRDRQGPVREGDEIQPANSRAGKLLALRAKLHEEVEEIARQPDDPLEYADMLELLLEHARECGVPWADIESAMSTKHRRKGGFRRGLVLTNEDMS